MDFKTLSVCKVGELIRVGQEGSFFNSYYTEVWGMMLLYFLEFSTLPLILTS